MDKSEAILIISSLFKDSKETIVPLIGNNAFYCETNNSDKRPISLNQYIVRQLLGESCEQDSNALREKDFLRSMTMIRKKLGKRTFLLKLDEIIQSERFRREVKMNGHIKAILQKVYAPLIISTSWLPKDIFLRLLQENNDMSYDPVFYTGESNSIELKLDSKGKSVNHNVVFLLSIQQPLVNKPIVTEWEFVEWLHRIHDSDTRPKNLMDYIQNKSLFTLGCEMPDWSYRFLLYALKNKPKNDEEILTGATIDNSIEQNLKDYLEDIEFYTDNEMEQFLSELNDKIPDRNPLPRLFLSYTAPNHTTDYKQIEKLKNRLEQKFEVFFFPDDDERSKGGARYWKDIEDALNKSDYIMSVITQRFLNTLNSNNWQQPQTVNKDKEPGVITELKMAIQIMENSDNHKLKQCIPLLHECTLNELKDALKKSNGVLDSLYFGGDGTNAIIKSIDEFSVNDIQNRIISEL